MRSEVSWKLFGLIVFLISLCSCAYVPSLWQKPSASLSKAPVGMPLAAAQERSSLAARLPARQSRAKELMKHQDLATALIQWEILHTLDPGNPEFSRQLNATQALIEQRVAKYLQLGKRAFQRGDFKRAKREFLRVLALDSSQSLAPTYLRKMEQHHLKNVQRTKLAKLAQARADMASQAISGHDHQHRHAAKVEPDHLEVGLQHLRQGDFETSIQTLRHYLAINPQHYKAKQYLAEAHFQLGHRLHRQGKLTDALMHYETARETVPGKTSQINQSIRQLHKALAQTYYQKGLETYQTDLGKAIEFWRASLSFDPQHSRARWRLENANQLRHMLRQFESK